MTRATRKQLVSTASYCLLVELSPEHLTNSAADWLPGRRRQGTPAKELLSPRQMIRRAEKTERKTKAYDQKHYMEYIEVVGLLLA